MKRTLGTLIPKHLRSLFYNEARLWRIRLGGSPRQGWTLSGITKTFVYFRSSNIRLLFSEGLPSHNLDWLEHLRPNDILMCQVPCYLPPPRLRLERAIMDHIGLASRNVVVLGNTEETVRVAQRLGFRATYVNQNCWLDEDLFLPLPREEKLYDAVIVSNPLPIKRTELAAKVGNLAIFTNIPYGKLRTQIPHAFYAEQASPDQVRKIINQSRVGLCLSQYEGACYASSEYLLCGVPVVTTECQGGREIWYDRDNHAATKARPESVARAVRELSSRTLDGDSIRQTHIKTSMAFRQRFVKLTQTLCEEYGERGDHDDLFRRRFCHKMGGYRPVSELVDEMAAA